MMGLNILHEYGYIAFPLNCWGQYDFTIYKFAQKQPENTYYYYGGHNIQESPPVVIMEDKDGNHKDGYKLYLYNDGNIVTAKMP